MESQEQIDNANLLLTKHRLKLEWNQMVWSVNNLRCGTAGRHRRHCRHRSPMSESQQQAQEAVSARSQRAANFWQPFYVIRLNSVLWLCRWRWCGGLRRGRWLGCRWLGCCPSGIGLIVQLNDFIGHVDVC